MFKHFDRDKMISICESKRINNVAAMCLSVFVATILIACASMGFFVFEPSELMCLDFAVTF